LGPSASLENIEKRTILFVPGLEIRPLILQPVASTYTDCAFADPYIYRLFKLQADWTLTHTNHKDTDQNTTAASIRLDGVTLADSLIR
jgi:hypothetical protein